jgi:uncharacterized protein
MERTGFLVGVGIVSVAVLVAPGALAGRPASYAQAEPGFAVPPAPTRHATDTTGSVPREAISRLASQLAAFEQATSNQVVLYVSRRVPEGVPLEVYTLACFNNWGVGQPGKNNGIVVFVFLDDRKVRIAVGLGLETVLTNELCQRIMDESILPSFHANDIVGGLDAGLSRILAELRARVSS